VYTPRLLEVWNGGRFDRSYCDLHRAVCERVRGQAQADPQEPQILLLGKADLSFPLETAFHLNPSWSAAKVDVVSASPVAPPDTGGPPPRQQRFRGG
jgi:hypothetical protein